MAHRSSTPAKKGSTVPEAPRKPRSAPRSLKIAARGVKTGHDFANLMAALMSDLIEGRVTPSIGNATCNAGGKLLKVVEMQYKYGSVGEGGGKQQRRILNLTLDEADATDTAPAELP